MLAFIREWCEKKLDMDVMGEPRELRLFEPEISSHILPLLRTLESCSTINKLNGA